MEEFGDAVALAGRSPAGVKAAYVSTHIGFLRFVAREEIFLEGRVVREFFRQAGVGAVAREATFEAALDVGLLPGRVREPEVFAAPRNRYVPKRQALGQGTSLRASAVAFDDFSLLVFGLLDVWLVVFVLAVLFQIQRTKLSIQQMIDRLSDSSTYAQTLTSIARATPGQERAYPNPHGGLSRDLLLRAFDAWTQCERPSRIPRTLKDLARIAGRDDFVSLLFSTGLRNGLLVEHRRREIGILHIEYEVAV